MKTAISIRGLTKRYKGFDLEEVTFSVPAGYIMGLIGPNGAGKTTIIKLIMDLVHADEGSVEVMGFDVSSLGANARSMIGYVPDEPHFFDDVNLSDHAIALAPFYPRWNQPLFVELSEEFELPLKKRFKHLSQGLRIKFAIALALAREPSLLIMDEPTTGLDPVFRSGLLARLTDFVSDEERTVLFSTHITSDLETSADFVTFIHDGRVIFSDTTEQIHSDYATVRGGSVPADIDPKNLVGLKKGDLGFEALTNNAGSIRDPSLVVEPATLEEIMYYIKKESDRVLQPGA